MSRTKLLTIAVIALLLLNSGVLAVLLLREGRGAPGRPPHEGRPREVIIRKLDLDAVQQEKYDRLIMAHRRSIDSLQEASFEIKDRLYGMLKDTAVDRNAADLLIRKAGEMQQQTELVNFEHFRQIRLLCRPDQITRFNELAGELTRLFSAHRPPPGPPPGPRP